MKKHFLFIAIVIISIILFYPTVSNSFSTGSPGGKTGSPTDDASCTNCHYAGSGSGATITSNIPLTGYIPNQTYTITADIAQSGINKFGFEITAEEANMGSAKKGTFFVTNNNETKLVNNNNSITHKAAGTSSSNSKSWSMDWEAPNAGSGPITFYGAFIAGNEDGNNSGDTYHTATYTVNEGTINTIKNIYSENNIIFHSINKTIELTNNTEFALYNVEGKKILSSKKKYTSLVNLAKGTYIIRSKNKSKKIILN